jgi:hypothetical protein
MSFDQCRQNRFLFSRYDEIVVSLFVPLKWLYQGDGELN